MWVYIYLYVYTYFYCYLKASPDFNPLQVEMSMMHLSPVWQLIHSPSQQRSGPSCWNVVKQQLFHHCSDGQNPAQNLPNFFLKQPLLTVVHHRCRVVDGGAASVSPERVWEFATGWARPGQALGPGLWSAAITRRCRAGQVSHNHPLGRPAVLCSRAAEEAARWRFAVILVRFYTAELC